MATLRATTISTRVSMNWPITTDPTVAS